MKRTALLAVLVALAAHAAPDANPWVKVQDQQEHAKPALFDQAVDVVGPLSVGFVDAGTLTVTTSTTTTVNATTVKTTLLDAGSGYINGNLGVLGTEYVALIDAGALNVANNLGVGGSEAVTGTLGVGGVTTLVALDAGQVKVAAVLVPVAKPIDGGTDGQPQVQYGNCTLSSNACTVTFNPAFAILPMCVCSSTNATAAACDPSATSTTQTVLKGANAADVVMFICIGGK